MPAISELNTDHIREITALFKSVFTAPPWNDDWSDEKQLNEYIKVIMGNTNPLALGLFEDGRLIGIVLGYLKHWYSGTEYYIEEFCIDRQMQGQGMGTYFFQRIEEELKKRNITHIFLQTERTMPAYEFYKKTGFLELKDHVSFAKRLL